MRHLLLPAILLLLSGCASDWAAKRESTISNAFQQHGAAQACCQGYSDISFTELRPGANVADINSSAPAFAFPTGISYFAAYSLPTRGDPYKLRVKSILVGDAGYIPAMVMLFPLATFLDKDMREIAREEVAPKVFHSSVFGDSEGGGVGHVAVPAGAAFVLFHTSSEYFGRTFNFSRSGGGAMIGTTYVSGGTYEFSVPFVPIGRLRVELARGDDS
jgi:hypothetical protein